jgi:hypothetical protein
MVNASLADHAQTAAADVSSNAQPMLDAMQSGRRGPPEQQ